MRGAGEEGDAQNIWDTIRELKARRIDHGVHCVDDPALMKHLEQTQLPLTVCPLSNQKVRRYAGSGA
jgi:adenosine deaminase